MAYTNTEAHNKAAELVKVALESGSTKLIGGSSNAVSSENHAKADAKYLTTLIGELAAFIKQVQ